jgi:putative hydrolase of the HAD superfamily
LPQINVIAFDADDTLWHTEHIYAEAEAKFLQLMAHYHTPEWIQQRLHDTEIRNLQHFGYGIKSYVLSLIETAVELSEGRVTGVDIQVLVDVGKEMLAVEVELLDHVADIVRDLAQRYTLMLITKGDLFEQEGKIARSGLAGYFRHIDVVSDKNRDSYHDLLSKHHIAAEGFMMIGNSLRSDIWPVLELGGSAVYIPYRVTWAHEVIDPPAASHAGFYQLDHVGQLPALLRSLRTN